MRKLLILLFLALFIIPVSLQAGIYGTLKGKVVDQDGKPVMGASVRLLGSARGAYVKNPDGSFTITNIDPGKYTIKVTSVGFQDYEIKEVQISADQTASIDVKLESKEVTTKGIVVTANRVMVNNTDIGQKRTMTTDDIGSVAREGISSVIGLTPGVVQAGGGYSVRGSRPEDTKIRRDGVDVSNQFTGGGAGLPGPTEFDTEEIGVITGGAPAEYGDAMGGIINTQLKRGRTEYYEGYVRYRTDVSPLYGSQASGKKLVYDESKDAYQAIASGDGAKLQGPGQHRFAFGAGGPVPGLDKSTFYVLSNYAYRKWNGAGFEIYDPIGNNLGKLPDQQNWEKYSEGRLRFLLAQGVELTVAGGFGSINSESSSSAWLYAKDDGWVYDWKTRQFKMNADGTPVTNGIPERIAKQGVSNAFNNIALLRINHALTATSYYTLTVANSSIKEEYSKRNGWEDPNFFTGFDVWYPQDKYGISGFDMIEGKPNKIIDNYEVIQKTSSTADGYGSFDYIQRNPLTGYIEGQGDATGTNNPYGRTQSYYQHGNTTDLSFRSSDIWTIDGQYSQVFEGEFRHNFTTGADFTYYTLARHSNNLPYDGNPFFDVYTDEWGGNLYSADDSAGWKKT